MGVLESGGKHFSKGLLKRFIRLLFLHFLGVSPSNVTSIPFWDGVGLKLTDLMNQGDTLAQKLLPLFNSACIERGEVGKQPPPDSTPVTSSMSSRTSFPVLGETCRANHSAQGSQASLSLPVSPCLSQHPCPGSTGHAARDPSLHPSTPVQTAKLVRFEVPLHSPSLSCFPKVAPKGHRMAETTWSSLSLVLLLLTILSSLLLPTTSFP